MEDVTGDILDGHLVIFIDGWNEALSYDFHSIETRAVEEPSSEVVVKGPHEGTVEDLKKNIGMIRSRLRNPQFKLENLMAGQKTKNEVVFGYLEGTVNPEVLKEFKKRVADIDKEEILDTSYIEELIEDSTWSPFPQHRYTERPGCCGVRPAGRKNPCIGAGIGNYPDMSGLVRGILSISRRLLPPDGLLDNDTLFAYFGVFYRVDAAEHLYRAVIFSSRTDPDGAVTCDHKHARRDSVSRSRGSVDHGILF